MNLTDVFDSPLRPSKPASKTRNAPAHLGLSSFQKHEALVLTDNSDAFMEWPTEQKKPSIYSHTPIINKVVIRKDKPRNPALNKQRIVAQQEPDRASMQRNLSSIKSKGGISSGEKPSHSNVRKQRGRTYQQVKQDESHIETQPNEQEYATADVPSSLEDYITNQNIGDHAQNGANALLMRAEQLLRDVTSCIKPTSLARTGAPSFPVPATSSIAPGQLLSGNPRDQIFMHPSSNNKSSFQNDGQLTSHDVLVLASSKFQLEPTSSGAKGTTAPPAITLGRVEGLGVDLTSDVAQVDWLIRGLPEAYESEPTFDDEAVEAILKEGGPAPTQLALPSVYAAGQRVLEKLATARALRVDVQQLLVFSARYGLRKEGTYLLIHPPSGCVKPANSTPSDLIPLPELQDTEHQVAQLLHRHDKRDSIKNYFVGTLMFKGTKQTEFELDVTDAVMQQWLNADPNGCVKIEIFSPLAHREAPQSKRHISASNYKKSSKSSGSKPSYSEPVCFGSTMVPLGGLLGTASLDAVIQCHIDVDLATHSAVCSRMENLSFGRRTPTAQLKPLSKKLGIVTLRLSVIPDADKVARAMEAYDKRTVHAQQHNHNHKDQHSQVQESKQGRQRVRSSKTGVLAPARAKVKAADLRGEMELKAADASAPAAEHPCKDLLVTPVVNSPDRFDTTAPISDGSGGSDDDGDDGDTGGGGLHRYRGEEEVKAGAEHRARSASQLVPNSNHAAPHVPPRPARRQPYPDGYDEAQDPLHQALQYSPEEVPAPAPATTNTNSSSSTHSSNSSGRMGADANRPAAAAGSSEPGSGADAVKGKFGILGMALCGVEDLLLPAERVVAINNAGLSATQPSLDIVFRMAPNIKDRVEHLLHTHHTDYIPATAGLVAVSAGKMYPCADLRAWRAPVVEVWLAWNDLPAPTPDQLDNQQHQHLHHEGRHKHQAAEEVEPSVERNPPAHVKRLRHLLGLAKYPPPAHPQQLADATDLGETMSVPIVDVGAGLERGRLLLSLHARAGDHAVEEVENAVQCSLHDFILSIRGSSAAGSIAAPPSMEQQPPFPYSSSSTAATTNTVAPQAKPTHSAVVTASKESLTAPSVSPTPHQSQEHSHVAGAPDEKDHGPDDSIDDLLALLHDPPSSNPLQRGQGSANLSAMLTLATSSAVAGAAEVRVSDPDVSFDTSAGGPEPQPAPPLPTAAPRAPFAATKMAPEAPLPPKVPAASESSHREKDHKSHSMHHNDDSSSSSRTALSRQQQQQPSTAVHLLDFAVEGSFSMLSMQPAAADVQQIFGCFVCYELPGLNAPVTTSLDEQLKAYLPYHGQQQQQAQQQQGGSATHPRGPAAMWWDGECPYLNGSQRHKFQVSDSSSAALQRALGLIHPVHSAYPTFTDSLGYLLERDSGTDTDANTDTERCVVFSLVFCDEDGNLPEQPLQFGEARLPLHDLHAVFSRSGASQRFQLPITRTASSAAHEDGFIVSPNADDHLLHLTVSHRVEPVLLSISAPSSTLATNQTPTDAPAGDGLGNPLGFDLTFDDLKRFLDPSDDPAKSIDSIKCLLKRKPVEAMSTDSLKRRSSVQLEVLLEEYTHLSKELLRVDGAGSIFCTIETKIAPEFESVHNLAEVPSEHQRQTQVTSMKGCAVSGTFQESFQLPLQGHLLLQRGDEDDSGGRDGVKGRRINEDYDHPVNNPRQSGSNMDSVVASFRRMTLRRGARKLLRNDRDSVDADYADYSDGDDDQEGEEYGGNHEEDGEEAEEKGDEEGSVLGVSRGITVDTRKLCRGSVVVVSIYLRQQLFSTPLPPNPVPHPTPGTRASNPTSSSSSSDEVKTNTVHLTAAQAQLQDPDMRSVNLTDQLLGTAAVDLTTLALGMQQVQGWYHFMDDLHNTVGQVKLSVSLIAPPISTTTFPSTDVSAGAGAGAAEKGTQSYTDVQRTRTEHPPMSGVRWSVDSDDSATTRVGAGAGADKETLRKVLDDLTATSRRLLEKGSDQHEQSTTTSTGGGEGGRSKADADYLEDYPDDFEDIDDDDDDDYRHYAPLHSTSNISLPGLVDESLLASPFIRNGDLTRPLLGQSVISGPQSPSPNDTLSSTTAAIALATAAAERRGHSVARAEPIPPHQTTLDDHSYTGSVRSDAPSQSEDLPSHPHDPNTDELCHQNLPHHDAAASGGGGGGGTAADAKDTGFDFPRCVSGGDVGDIAAAEEQSVSVDSDIFLEELDSEEDETGIGTSPREHLGPQEEPVPECRDLTDGVDDGTMDVIRSGTGTRQHEQDQEQEQEQKLELKLVQEQQTRSNPNKNGALDEAQESPTSLSKRGGAWSNNSPELRRRMGAPWTDEGEDALSISEESSEQHYLPDFESESTVLSERSAQHSVVLSVTAPTPCTAVPPVQNLGGVQPLLGVTGNNDIGSGTGNGAGAGAAHESVLGADDAVRADCGKQNDANADTSANSGADDSPNTSKIKGLIDQEIGRIFGPEVLEKPVLPKSSATSHAPAPKNPPVSTPHASGASAETADASQVIPPFILPIWSEADILERIKVQQQEKDWSGAAADNLPVGIHDPHHNQHRRQQKTLRDMDRIFRLSKEQVRTTFPPRDAQTEAGTQDGGMVGSMPEGSMEIERVGVNGRSGAGSTATAPDSLSARIKLGILPAGVLPAATSGVSAAGVGAGRRKQFLDAETDRVSNIMRGLISKASR